MKKDHLKEIREKIYRNTYVPVRMNAKKPASVLIPLTESDHELSILFEKRSASITQPLEISFPGGSIEPNETAVQCALRETSEELLIAPEKISILSLLNEMSGPSGRIVYSHLGFLHDYQFTFSKQEVSCVFTMPLSWFFTHEPEIYKGTYVFKPEDAFPYERIPNGRNYAFQNVERRFLFYESPYGWIWGLTAELLYQFIQELK